METWHQLPYYPVQRGSTHDKLNRLAHPHLLFSLARDGPHRPTGEQKGKHRDRHMND
ncbi:hypothetical protein KC19_VG192600 [Ceratodon purpureus]|uniref:Uncharacterized protein n=1 Tax=Ceratodon purpureus TaxID=3225 RepID=A0A8T0HRL4_CERPU|nr:hypothetical protein KC19_VG192600 [Ceratodon purpureus]